MWTYEQATGKLSHDGKLVGTGYSGAPGHVNKPTDETLKALGPIPHGTYKIGKPYTHEHLGVLCMNLDALPGTDTHGRGDFRIHGDNWAGNQSASEGCIIMGKDIRQRVADSNETVLTVVKG